MIRNDIYAIFNGKEYETYHPSTKEYYLLSNDKSDLENGFLQSPSKRELITVDGEKFIVPVKNYENKFLRKLTKEDVFDIFKINTFGIYKGHEFRVKEKKENEYLIYADDQRLAEELQFEEFDRGGFRKWVDEKELDPIYERKIPLPDFFD